MTTFELARLLGIQAESLRKAVTRNGHYFGIVPARLANRRLIWPEDSVVRLKNYRPLSETAIQNILAMYPGSEPEDMAHRMKAALAKVQEVPRDLLAALGIEYGWISDIRCRLEAEGLNVVYGSDGFDPYTIVISRASQQKLQRESRRG